MKAIPAILSLVFASVPAIESAAGAVIVQYSDGAGSTPGTPDYADSHLGESTAFGPCADSGIVRGKGLSFTGWGQNLELGSYAGFIVSAQPGYSLCLTDLNFVMVNTGLSVDGYAWAYRIDNGAGFGNWVFGSVLDGGGGVVKLTWDFDDIETPGGVEFGVFARSGDSGDMLSLKTVSVSGTVPEPAAALLSLLSLAAIGCRRLRA